MNFTKDLVLAASISKQFLVTQTQIVEREGQRDVTLPNGRVVKRQRKWTEEVQVKTPQIGGADRIRFVSFQDMKNERMLTVRFVYGRVLKGKFDPAVKRSLEPDGSVKYMPEDGGVVFHARGYVEADFCHCTPTEDQVLDQVVQAMSWAATKQPRAAI